MKKINKAFYSLAIADTNEKQDSHEDGFKVPAWQAADLWRVNNTKRFKKKDINMSYLSTKHAVG